VSNALGKSKSFTADKRTIAPAFFTFDGKRVIAVDLGSAGLVSPAKPAKPGDTVLLFGTGFGPTVPPLNASQTLMEPAPLASLVKVRIGGVVADVLFADVVSSGICQLTVTIPDLPSGDADLLASIEDASTQDGISLTIGR
jgi:uncharacterized protein (TIGR03437 family)